MNANNFDWPSRRAYNDLFGLVEKFAPFPESGDLRKIENPKWQHFRLSLTIHVYCMTELRSYSGYIFRKTADYVESYLMTTLSIVLFPVTHNKYIPTLCSEIEVPKCR